jgi:DNA-binding response OmpR family regulator
VLRNVFVIRLIMSQARTIPEARSGLAGYAFCDNLSVPLTRSDDPTMRLLLVEDDRMIGDSLRGALRLEGYAVDWVRDASAANGTLASERFDLVLLDLGLPASGAPNAEVQPAGGLEVLRALRARQDLTPCIVLTARDGPGDKVAGLDAGADDYLVKPFDLDELTARIRAVMRRHAGRGQSEISFGGVTLDPATRQVTRDGVPVLLSAREFAVLEALMQRPGALLSRAQLEDRLYGWGEEIESNAVSVYIHQLRRKLGTDFIQNVRGVGYFVGDKPRGN